jgi:hypothetical protein
VQHPDERDGTPAALPRRGQHQAGRREERARHREAWAEHPEEQSMHREARVELLYVCVPSRSLRGGMPDELAGERSAFVEHRSYTRIASLRLRRASRRRHRHARGEARNTLRARSASLRLSWDARGIRTASLWTGSDARPIRADARPVRTDARRERTGAFRSTYRSPTRGQRCPD